jgi:hypothetical protein
VLQESPASYSGILGHENYVLRNENAYFRDDNPESMLFLVENLEVVPRLMPPL